MALLLLWLGTGHANNDDAPLVAVASSLRHVWPHLMIKYQNPVKPRVTFGSSGNLARQITQGAPFELLLSADESFPAWLVENKTTGHSPVIYTQGKLAWVAPIGSSLAKSLLKANSNEEASLKLPDDVTRIAIANPAFAPYGRAAKAVLNSINRGKSVTLVTGENAAQTLQFALSGASAGGIVPMALVSETAREKLPAMVVTEIQETLHEPVMHAMVLIDQSSTATKTLFDFLLSHTAQSVFMEHGFLTVQ
ncbi:MAG: molybdate ABC transporter substrate-binding protein [Gammaproteobacteria bacterium]|nr:molybdate ABC transporter substrate-binding protein [Gammaproteobacteria bacterium]